MHLLKKPEVFPKSKPARIFKIKVHDTKRLLGKTYLHVTYRDENNQLRNELVGETAQRERLIHDEQVAAAKIKHGIEGV